MEIFSAAESGTGARLKSTMRRFLLPSRLYCRSWNRTMSAHDQCARGLSPPVGNPHRPMRHPALKKTLFHSVSTVIYHFPQKKSRGKPESVRIFREKGNRAAVPKVPVENFLWITKKTDCDFWHCRLSWGEQTDHIGLS